MSENRLKPCPFCGAPGELCTSKTSTGLFFVNVRCSFCNAQAKSYASKKDPAENNSWDFPPVKKAVTTWNIRSRGE